MDQPSLFRPFWWRLLGQALLRALLVGVTAGAGTVFLLSLIFHILLRPTDWKLFLILSGVAFGACFLAVLILLFPTKKTVAKRLDEAGLQERAGTMLAFRKQSGFLVRLQRQDAISHIRKADPKILGKPLPKRLLICCGLCLCLSVTMLLLPHDVFAPASYNEETARRQQVADLIEDLRQKVRDAELAEELEKELLAMLDQLEKELLAAQSELDQAALVEQAQKAISEKIIFTQTRHVIGKALQEFSLTAPLGQQFCSDDPANIGTHMDELENHVTNSTPQIARLSSNILSSLESSGVMRADALYYAMEGFANELDGLFKPVMPADPELPEAPPEQTPPIDIPSVFREAETAILEALTEQLHMEEDAADTAASITAGLGDFLKNEEDPLLTQSGQTSSGGSSEGSSSGGSGNGSTDYLGPAIGGLTDSNFVATVDKMLDPIYDPISGSVTYGEVFAAYYAEYLAALEKGDIPEELLPYLERYFSALS